MKILRRYCEVSYCEDTGLMECTKAHGFDIRG